MNRFIEDILGIAGWSIVIYIVVIFIYGWLKFNGVV